MKSRYCHGFTLVELLTVIGIISILIAMLLPALNRAREAAKKVQCASNIRQMCQALLMYANENKGVFPTGTYVGAMLLGDRMKTSPEVLWKTYGLSPGVIVCPSNSSSKRPTLTDSPLYWGGGVYQILLGYTYVGGFGGYVSTPVNSWNGWVRARIGDIDYPPSYSLTQKARNASEAPLILDRAWDIPVAVYPNGVEAANHLARDGSGRPEGENVGYVDGHVQWYRWSEVKARNHSYMNTFTTIYY